MYRRRLGRFTKKIKLTASLCLFSCLWIKQRVFSYPTVWTKTKHSSGKKPMWSINHSQAEEILCKVFGDDSWLVGAAKRELGFCERCGVVTLLSSATSVYANRCVCLCVCLGCGEQRGRWQAACFRWGKCYLQLAPWALLCACMLCACVSCVFACKFKAHWLCPVSCHRVLTATVIMYQMHNKNPQAHHVTFCMSLYLEGRLVTVCVGPVWGHKGLQNSF